MNKDNISAANNRSNSEDAFDLSLSAPAGLDASAQTDNIPTELMNIHAMLPQKEIHLPPGYQPRNSVDILCGRGKQYWKENVHFRHFIKQVSLLSLSSLFNFTHFYRTSSHTSPNIQISAERAPLSKCKVKESKDCSRDFSR